MFTALTQVTVSLSDNDLAFGSKVMNSMLRSFFPGRSYVRLFTIGGGRGYRIASVPFLNARMKAMIG